MGKTIDAASLVRPGRPENERPSVVAAYPYESRNNKQKKGIWKKEVKTKFVFRRFEGSWSTEARKSITCVNSELEGIWWVGINKAIFLWYWTVISIRFTCQGPQKK